MKSLEEIKQDFILRIKYLFEYGWLGKLFGSFITFGLALIPFYIYLICYIVFDPIGFWQNITLLVVWIIALGWFQVLALIAASVIVFSLWTEV